MPAQVCKMAGRIYFFTALSGGIVAVIIGTVKDFVDFDHVAGLP